MTYIGEDPFGFHEVMNPGLQPVTPKAKECNDMPDVM
jgi:hypothetical protein